MRAVRGAGRILLIDDNQQGQAARRIILEGLGYEVRTANCGQAGLQVFAETAEKAPFGLVVTDYRMPGIQGDEVVARLRLIDPEVPLVMLSGYVRLLALTPESTGADVVLAKGPLEQFELADTVQRLVPVGGRVRGKPPATERRSARAGAGPRAAAAHVRA